MLRKIFDFFLFSSLFISLCAVVMVYQTYQLLIYEQPSATLLLFIFFSTVCSYNFHWWLTPTSVHSSQRIYWAQQHKGLHLFLYIIGLVACVIFFFMSSDIILIGPIATGKSTQGKLLAAALGGASGFDGRFEIGLLQSNRF